MSENNSNEVFLRVREIINETLLRDVFIFVVFYLFILSQSWTNIFLLLFPIITFSFSFFFRIINSNKHRYILVTDLITYNPLGLERKHANRLNFATLVQLILLFWIGAESFYHPQLIETYDLFFNIFFFLFFTFGFYWIFIDIWKYAKIAISLKKINTNKTLSFLNIRLFRLISIANLITFLLLNILNIFFGLLIDNNILSGFAYYLPGTGIENSSPLFVSIMPFIFIWMSPLIASVLFSLIYKDLNSITPADLVRSFKELPEEVRKQLIDNFAKINTKFKHDLDTE
ncbi:MAG: hypothetical protein HWN79_03700 [Candidatus Lokiarchaeota archaeon]|nr:hypothetical protein [Candidatus Lokiarchaeota archaeon]